MLGKLMKYELRASARILLLLYAAVLATAAIARAFMSTRLDWPTGISMTVYVSFCVALFVVTLIIVVQRFYQNLLGNEGYLMFTLPVKTESLILSKALAALIWFVAGGVVICVSGALVGLTWPESWGILTRFFETLQNLNERYLDGTLALFIVEGIAFTLISIFSLILLIYVCIAIGHLANKHKLLSSFAAYIAITTLLQIIWNIVASVLPWSSIEDILSSLRSPAFWHTLIDISIASCAVVGVVFFIVTNVIVKKRLNLE